ncbi:hypothetical protein ABID29_001872 [Streptococcus rupicaprae]|uniref:PH domain-containing protein n=1 Tax=Streptococcus rupicaprae TaxID=759619 RepID=A0ABV2FJK5_9STRE
MPDVVIEKNPSRLIHFLIFYLLFILVSVGFVGFSKGIEAAILIIAFFVPLVVLLLVFFLSVINPKRPWVLVTETGITYYANRYRPLCLKWSDIREIGCKDINIHRGGRERVIILTLVQPRTFFGGHEKILSLRWAKDISMDDCIKLLQTYHYYAKDKG